MYSDTWRRGAKGGGGNRKNLDYGEKAGCDILGWKGAGEGMKSATAFFGEFLDKGAEGNRDIKRLSCPAFLARRAEAGPGQTSKAHNNMAGKRPNKSRTEGGHDIFWGKRPKTGRQF